LKKRLKNLNRLGHNYILLDPYPEIDMLVLIKKNLVVLNMELAKMIPNEP